MLQQAQAQQQWLLQQSAPISAAFLKVEEPSPEVRADALMEFTQLLNSCTLSEGLELGHQIRIEGGVLRLCQLLLDPSPDVVSLALWCLGNLCSDSVDPQSKVTKALLLECGAELAILRCLASQEVSTLVYAAGLCLNLSSSAEWCAVMLVEGAIVRFEQLVHHSEPQARACRHRAPHLACSPRSAPRLVACSGGALCQQHFGQLARPHARAGKQQQQQQQCPRRAQPLSGDCQRSAQL